MNGLHFLLFLLCLGLCFCLAYLVYVSRYPRIEKYLLYTLIFLIAAFMIVNIITETAQKQLKHYQPTIPIVHMVK